MKHTTHHPTISHQFPVNTHDSLRSVPYFSNSLPSLITFSIFRQKLVRISPGGYSTDACWGGRWSRCGWGTQSLTLFKAEISDFPILFRQHLHF